MTHRGLYHDWMKNAICLQCNRWCPKCNQCKCEVGTRKYLCPGFDAKANPMALEHWNLELQIEELEALLMYGIKPYQRKMRARVTVQLDKLWAEKNALANPDR